MPVGECVCFLTGFFDFLGIGGSLSPSGDGLLADLFLGRPRSRRYPKFNIRRDIPHDAYGTVAAVNGGKVYITNNILNLHYAAWGQERVLNQILVGVSTRNYESSLDKPAAKLKSRGTSKSAASRHLVSQTTKKLEEYLSRRLEEFELAALMLDGLEVAGQTVVVTLGITIDGTKVPLGIWLGSTENSRVCTAMLQDLLERGLRVDESILCVVDGGKGIRKALVDVLGDLAVIQRCQIHKLRNLRSYLPKSRHAYVLQTMKEAYKCKSADKARKRLQALVSWLERNGYDEAAGSLREGMEETLTVVKLALPALLRQSLATTNAIENLNGTIRRVSRNVKRWKSPSMVRRWTALGVVTAQKEFRRIKGYRHMGALVHALRSKQKSLDSDEFAA